MAASKPRISVLVSVAEKRTIAANAKSAGLSVGEFMRKAASSFRPTADDAALERLFDQVRKSTARADRAIDEAIAYVETSNRRLVTSEKRSKSRAKSA